MYTYDLNEVYRLTGLSDSKRKSLVYYYYKLPESIRIEAHKLQTDLIRQHRNKIAKSKENEFYYSFFLLALHKMQSIETGTKRKESLSEDQLKKLDFIRKERIKSSHKKKSSPLKKLIEIRYFELINKLRSENVSWRDISVYIAKYHKKRISHQYLKKCFEDIKVEQNKYNQ